MILDGRRILAFNVTIKIFLSVVYNAHDIRVQVAYAVRLCKCSASHSTLLIVGIPTCRNYFYYSSLKSIKRCLIAVCPANRVTIANGADSENSVLETLQIVLSLVIEQHDDESRCDDF